MGQYVDALTSLGGASLNALYPKDFSWSMLALELVDSQQNTVDYFMWPILPDEIVETDVTLTNVRKTMTGVNVQKNQTFNPKNITLRGDFGRNFKLLLGGNQVIFAGFGLSTQSGQFSASSPNFFQNQPVQFSTIAKTGYGCVKLLESMKEKSKQLDGNGKPFSLFLIQPDLR